MIVSISQPAYLPWLGYFDRINKSDLAIVLDHVQIERRGVTHRNKILGQHGSIWLTVPIDKKGNFTSSINTITINQGVKWKNKHKETIRQCYSKVACFKDYFDDIASFYEQEWVLLNDLLMETSNYLLQTLKITTPLQYSTEMNVSGTKSDLILNLCKEVGASKYISGPFGREYLNRKVFDKANIEVLFHDYKYPRYDQSTSEFIPKLSILDLLFRYGHDSLSILSEQQKLGTKW